MRRIFIVVRDAGKGLTCRDVRIFSQDLFVHRHRLIPQYSGRRNIRVGTPDGRFTKRISAVTLHEFRTIFNKDEIETMQENGMLDYNPNETEVYYKYPIFRAEVYKKYGIKKGE